MRTGLQAIAAHDTTAHINAVFLGIDATGLAITRTKAATIAFFQLEYRTEEREAAEESQYRSHGTDRVAVSAASAPCQETDNKECAQSNAERRQTAHPHIHGIKGVGVVMLRDGSQPVIRPLVEGLHQVGGNAAIGTVRRNEDGQTIQPCHHKDDEQHEHQHPQGSLGRRIGVLVGKLCPFVLTEQLALT